MKKQLATLVVFLLPVILLAQVSETQSYVEDDFSPGLFAIVMIVFVGIAAIIIALTIILLLVIALAAFLVFCGVLSAAVLNGLYHHSFTKGALLFINVSMTLAGGTVGLTTGLLMKATFHIHLSPANTLFVGFTIGAVLGWLIAKTALKAGRLLIQKFMLPNKSI